MTVKKRVLIGIFSLLFVVATLIELSSWLDRLEMRELISLTTNQGAEIKTHTDFVNTITKDPRIAPAIKVKVFIGTYSQMLEAVGTLLPDPPDYYIMVDYLAPFDQSEMQVLIAHELGHTIYGPDFIEKWQIKTLNQFIRRPHLNARYPFFNTRKNQILTKYQVKADTFAVEKTSLERMLAFLNKLYTIEENRNNADYKMRLENLEKLQRQSLQKH